MATPDLEKTVQKVYRWVSYFFMAMIVLCVGIQLRRNWGRIGQSIDLFGLYQAERSASGTGPATVEKDPPPPPDPRDLPPDAPKPWRRGLRVKLENAQTITLPEKPLRDGASPPDRASVVSRP